MYSVISEGSVYTEPPYVLNLKAKSAYDQGYDYGHLMGVQAISNYNSLLYSLLGEIWNNNVISTVVNQFLDWQWENYLGVQVPALYKEEVYIHHTLSL